MDGTSFIESAYFEPQLLCNKILSIIENQDTLVSLSKTLLIDYNKRLSGNIFINKFADALN
jgi:hypothetical protein